MTVAREIVITGMGVVSPIGIGGGAFWESLCQGRSGVRRLDVLDGSDLAAPLGAEVKAVLKGKVVYADWFRGYGKLMIVDHGRGFTSLYAHLGEYAVRVGESVGEGQTIGYVGDTGYVAKPTLHFELRQDGAAVNPEPWIRR